MEKQAIKIGLLKQAMITEAHRVVEDYISDVVIDFMTIDKYEAANEMTGKLYYVLRKSGTNLCRTDDELKTTIEITGYNEVWEIDLDKFIDFSPNEHYSYLKKDGIMTLYKSK